MSPGSLAGYTVCVPYVGLGGRVVLRVRSHDGRVLICWNF